MYGGNAAIPSVAPVPGLGADDGRTQRPLRRCLQRGGVHAPWRGTDRALVEVDNAGVDGSVNALAALVSRTSNRLREMQTGFARNYALSMLAGAALVAAAILAVKLW